MGVGGAASGGWTDASDGTSNAPPPLPVIEGGLPFGLAPIVGVAGDALGTYFVQVDPSTGQEVLDVSQPGLSGAAWGDSAYDPLTNRLYGLVECMYPLNCVVSLDASNGAFAESPATPSGLSAIQIGGSDALFAMVPGTASNVYDFGTVVPETAKFTKISTLSGVAPLRGTAAVDRARGLYYQVDEDDPFDTRLRTVDVTTGALLHEVKTDRELDELEVAAGGKVIAVAVIEAQLTELCTVDPSTGVTTAVATLPSWTFTVGESAIDRDAGVLYLPFSSGPDLAQFNLGEVEIATGRTTSVPLVHDFFMLEVCSMCGAPATP